MNTKRLNSGENKLSDWTPTIITVLSVIVVGVFYGYLIWGR